jgi:hypothetical protein
VGARVHVPIRIRTDADGIGARRSDLEDALARTVASALARSTDMALSRHGGSITTAEPSFRWTGEAVDSEQRVEIERRLSRLVAEACTALSAANGGNPRGDARERLDRARAATGRYSVPSYQNAGTTDEIVFSDEDASATLEVFARLAVTADSLDELRRQIAYFSQGWRPVDHGAFPGLLWLEDDGSFQTWFVYEGGTRAYWLGPAARQTWSGDHFEVVELDPPPADVATLTVIQTFESDDLEAYRTFLRDREEDEIRAHVTDDAAVELELTRRAGALVDRHARTIMALQIGAAWETWYAFPFAGEARFDGIAQLYPVTAFERPRRPAGSIGIGVAGGGPAGDAGGAPGGVEGGGDRGEVPTQPLRFVSPVFSPDAPLVCEPFLGEPSVDALGADGERVKAAIAAIAERLQIESCGFAGQFCLMAAQTVASHAIGLGDALAMSGEAAVTEYRRNGSGNLGDIEMRPRTTVNALLARLAGAVPLIENLIEDVHRLYWDHGAQISGTYEHNPAGWNLHFLMEVPDAFREALARVFGETCRILMLQLLDASRAHVENRQAQLDALAHAFFVAVLPGLIDAGELIELKNRLDVAQMPPQVDYETGYVSVTPTDLPDIVYHDDEAVAIRDQRGRGWTNEQLQNAIALRRGLAEELEPLVKHIRNIPESVAAMRPSEAATRAELARILGDMLDDNAGVRDRVAWSWKDAFKYAPIDGDLPGETPGEIGRNLRGIHLLAHRELSSRLGTSRYYAEGVRGLFEGEHALEVVESLLVLGVLVVVSVLCPPLGYVAGVAVAGLQYLDAVERGRIRDALVSPEEVVDLAELDVERFAAALGLALAIIPEAPSLIRGAYRAGAAALEEGTVTAARRVALSALRRSAAEGLQRALAVGIAEAIGREFIKANALNAVISRALRPLLQSYYAASRPDEPVGGMRGALALIAWYRARRGRH